MTLSNEDMFISKDFKFMEDVPVYMILVQSDVPSKIILNNFGENFSFLKKICFKSTVLALPQVLYYNILDMLPSLQMSLLRILKLGKDIEQIKLFANGWKPD
jgi:uncharacterized protein